MKKIQRIIVSALISIVFIIAFNLLIKYIKKDTYKQVYITKSNIIIGEEIKEEDLIKTNIVEPKNTNSILDYTFKPGFIAKQDILKGQIMNNESTITKEKYKEEIKDFEYISIPIDEGSKATGYQIKKGDIVNVYATAKTKDTINLYKDAKKKCSSSLDNSYVTFKIFENIQVKSLIDISGNKVDSGKCTEVILMVKEDMAHEYIMLKQFSSFNITKGTENEI